MSPRRTRPTRHAAASARPGDDDAPLEVGGVGTFEVDADGTEWAVRRITGSSSTKTYRCPGCDQEIRPATPHVVAWPLDDLDRRRHWHTPCWNARSRRTAKQARRPQRAY